MVVDAENPSIRRPEVDVYLPTKRGQLPSLPAAIGRFDPRLEVSASGGRVCDAGTRRVPHTHLTRAVASEAAASSRGQVVHPDVTLARQQHATAVWRQADV